MSDERKYAHWGAIIGLATGVIALISAAVALDHMLNEQRSKVREQEVAFQHQKAEMELQRKLQQEKLAEAVAAQERAARCTRHQDNARAIDGDFDTLYREHGQLMSAMRACTQQQPDDQAQCGLGVCALAAWWTRGESNCLEVASRIDSIRQRAEAEQRLGTADGCQIGQSAVMTYFE